MPRLNANKWWRTKRDTNVHLNYNGESTCKYHYTTVVLWTNDYAILRTGGWDTMTTRDRMNQCAQEYDLPYNVWREKGQTSVVVRTGHVCGKKLKRYPIDGDDNDMVKVKFPKRKPKLPKNCSDCAMKLLSEAGGF